MSGTEPSEPLFVLGSPGRHMRWVLCSLLSCIRKFWFIPYNCYVSILGLVHSFAIIVNRFDSVDIISLYIWAHWKFQANNLIKKGEIFLLDISLWDLCLSSKWWQWFSRPIRRWWRQMAGFALCKYTTLFESVKQQALSCSHSNTGCCRRCNDKAPTLMHRRKKNTAQWMWVREWLCMCLCVL